MDADRVTGGACGPCGHSHLGSIPDRALRRTGQVDPKGFKGVYASRVSRRAMLVFIPRIHAGLA